MSRPDPMAWLRDVRKIDAKVLDALRVRPVDHPQLGPAVAFQYARGGEVYAAKFRTVDKQFRASRGRSRGLYNEDALTAWAGLPVVMTEGEIDALSVIQAGYDCAVSVPDGWKAGGGETAALVDAEARLRASPYVIVAGDDDEAGESLPRAVANLLKGHEVRVVRWPEGCKDANDVLVRHGEGALASCLAQARVMDPPGGFVTGFSDLPPMSERRVLRIDAYPFRRVVAFELGAMSVWTGIPGHGKSTFLTWAAHSVAIEEDVRVGMLAFETHPHTLRDQLFLIRTGRAYADCNALEREDTLRVLDRRFRLVHRTMDDGTAHRIAWLEEMIRTLAVRDRCKLIIVDPWNELEHMPEPGETMTAYINWAVQRIRVLAETYEVHVALVAHPRKMGDGYHAPTGYDVADSAAFYNKPSLGVSVHQREDEETGPYVELNVWKVRNTRLYGFEKGKACVRFDPVTQKYLKLEAQA